MINPTNKAEYELVYKDEFSGGFVYLHPNQNKLEKAHNQFVGVYLAKQGFKIWLLPPSGQPNTKTADAWLENENLVIEFKHCQTPTAAAIDKAIQKAKKQAAYILLHIDCDIEVDKLIEGVENRCQRPENQALIESVWLIWEGTLFRFTRNEINSKTWREHLKLNKAT